MTCFGLARTDARPIWILFAVSLAACNKSAPAAARRPTIPVETARAARISAPVEISANGIVEPMQSVAVEAQVGGILNNVAFKEGDPVAKGQLLFEIDPKPFQGMLRSAEAILRRDEAQATNATRDAERYRQLVAKDYVTKAQADQAEATAASLRATVAADSSAVTTARINLAYATISAPIAGRTGSLLVRRGNLVKLAGSPLVVINQLQPILVRFPVSQHDLDRLRRRAASGKVPASVAGSDSTPIASDGTLSFIDNSVDSLTGTVMAKAQFGNAGNGLWPGQYVRITVQLEIQPGVIAVPTRAIVPGQTGPYVFAVGPANVVAIRPVVVGRAVGDLTIVDSGVVAGEQIVTDGQSRLTPGDTVDVKAQKVAAPSLDSAHMRVPGPLGDTAVGVRSMPKKRSK